MAGYATVRAASDWDSLTHLILVSTIENAFGMKFSIREVAEMQNVGEMADILERHQTG